MKKKIKNITRTVSVVMIAMMTSGISMAQPGGQSGGQQGPPPVPSDKQSASRPFRDGNSGHRS